MSLRETSSHSLSAHSPLSQVLGLSDKVSDFSMAWEREGLESPPWERVTEPQIYEVRMGRLPAPSSQGRAPEHTNRWVTALLP